METAPWTYYFLWPAIENSFFCPLKPIGILKTYRNTYYFDCSLPGKTIVCGCRLLMNFTENKIC